MKVSVTIDLELSEREVEAITLSKSVSNHYTKPDEVHLEEYIKDTMQVVGRNWVLDTQHAFRPFYLRDLIPDGNGGYKLPSAYSKRF